MSSNYDISEYDDPKDIGDLEDSYEMDGSDYDIPDSYYDDPNDIGDDPYNDMTYASGHGEQSILRIDDVLHINYSICKDRNFVEDFKDSTRVSWDIITTLHVNCDVDPLIQILGSTLSLVSIKNLHVLHLTMYTIPVDISKFINVVTLGLNNNKIIYVPDEICTMSKLEYLNLSYNDIKRLPEQIGLLSNLKCLFLQQNKLSRLPSSIGKLSKLRELTLDDNDDLSDLPSSMGKLSPELHFSAYIGTPDFTDPDSDFTPDFLKDAFRL